MSYNKICLYCLKPFRTQYPGQKYCCETHKTYAYRQRRANKTKGNVCPKCFGPWEVPKVLKSTMPLYCARCQQYYRDRYRKLSSSQQ